MNLTGKVGNLWDAFWANDKCMRDKTSWAEMAACNISWPCWADLARTKAQACLKDGKMNCEASKQLAEFLGDPPPDCGGPTKGKGERPDPPPVDPNAEAKQQHESRAWGIMRQLVGRPCSADVQLADGTWDRCRPGADGGYYTIDSTRFPLSGKQLFALQDDVLAGARLGKDASEMLAEATRARDEFLAKAGITDPSKYEPGSGGGTGGTDNAGKADEGLSLGAKVGIGAGAVALVVAIVYAATRKSK